MYPFASTCGSSRSSGTDCTGAHGASSWESSCLPLGEGSLGELLVERGDTGRAVLPTHLHVGEPRIFGEVLAPDELAELGPVAIGLEEHELDVPPVLRPVDPDERVHQRPSPTRRGGGVPAQRGEDVGGQGPDGGGQKGHVHDRSLARASALEQSARHAEGQGQGAVAVPQRATLTDGVFPFGRAEHVGHAATGPEGRGVVPRPIGVGPTDPVPVAHGTHQARVAARPGSRRRAPAAATPWVACW